MNTLYQNVLANLTASEDAIAEAVRQLNERLQIMTEDETLVIDEVVAIMVFNAVFDAAEQCHQSAGDGWLEVFLQYLSMYDESNYNPFTGIRMGAARDIVRFKLHRSFKWAEYNRNWKRLIAVAADLLLSAPHQRPKDLEQALEAARSRCNKPDSIKRDVVLAE